MKNEKYVIHTFSGNKYVINKDQREFIKNNREDEIWFKDGKMVKRSAISEINKLEDERPDKIGYNSKGRKFIKRGGRWTDAQEPNSQLQLEHFPEVAKDQLMTKEQYKEMKKKEDYMIEDNT